MSYLDQIGATAAAFLTRDRRQERGVWISQETRRLAGDNLHYAAVWSQILYWHGIDESGAPRLHHVDEQGHYWLVKQNAEWMDECGVKACTARKALKFFEGAGYIAKMDGLSPFHRGENGMPLRAVFIRVNWESLPDWYLLSGSRSMCYEIADRCDTTYQTDVIPGSRLSLYTESLSTETPVIEHKTEVCVNAHAPIEPDPIKSDPFPDEASDGALPGREASASPPSSAAPPPQIESLVEALRGCTQTTLKHKLEAAAAIIAAEGVEPEKLAEIEQRGRHMLFGWQISPNRLTAEQLAGFIRDKPGNWNRVAGQWMQVPSMAEIKAKYADLIEWENSS